MYQLNRSEKLSQVRCDIRGPILTESNKIQAAGASVLRLNTGNPAAFGFSTTPEILAEMEKGVSAAQGYCDSKGLLKAREAIAAYAAQKGIRGVTAEDVYIGNGVSELITMTMLALLNPGDEILIPAPDYPLWTGSALLAGGKVVHYICDEQSEWMPDLADIRRKVNHKTRAIVLINPNNPTGALYPTEVLEEIIKIAHENNLILFSDEIYDRLVMDGLEHVSTASLAPDDMLVVTFNGLSKSHLVCGYRIGWMVLSGNQAAAPGFIEGLTLLASMRLCANVPAQNIVPLALQDEASTREMISPGGRVYEQRECVVRELSGIPGLSFVKPKAAFYIFPKLDVKRFHITDDEKFGIDYLRAKHVMIVNGRGFNWIEPDHFRIVYLPCVEELTTAMRGLRDFLSTYQQD